MPEYLTRDMILGKADRPVKKGVEIPHWGKVCLRVLTGWEKSALDREMFDPNTGKVSATNIPNWHARFASLVLSDEEGNRLFTDNDVEALSQKSAAALEAVASEGMKWNGYGEEAVADAEKNSETTPTSGSGSSSPDTSTAEP